MSFIPTTVTQTSGGTKQFAEYPIIFKFYQVKDSIISNKLYTDGSSAYPATAVGTGSFSTVESRLPLAGDLYETVYNPANSVSQVPVVGRQRNYTRVNCGGTVNGGAKWTVTWNLTSENWFAIAVKAPTSSVAGKLKIRSTASNEYVLAFTTSATANTWETKYFDFKTSGSTGVTITGVPVPATITEVEVTLDVISTSCDVAFLYATNIPQQIIGQTVTFTMPCVSEFAFENTLETADLICNQQVEQSLSTGRTISIKVGTKAKDVIAQSYALGDVPLRQTGRFLELYNSNTIGNRSISAGVMTIGSGLDLASVFIDGVGTLHPVNSATNVPEGGYHYTGSTLTFNTIHNGKVPVIHIFNTISKLTRSIKNLELGYVGFLQVPRRFENGKIEYITVPKAQVMLDAEGFNDDGDQVNFMFKVYPTASGVYAEIAND